MPFIAYKITHRESGKAYIGITIRSLKDRWAAHAAFAVRRSVPNQLGLF